jgi:hypothetical protein
MSLKTIIVPYADLITYLRLRREGWRTLWVGEGQICMGKKGSEEEGI